VGEAEYDLIQAEIAPHHVGTRTESAALLAWFLHAVWRLDLEDVDDAICDGGGDKGIDALVVNDDLREVAVFQSKHRKSATAGQGDQDLKNLVGAASYFTTPEAVDGLLASSPNVELRNLVLRQKIRDRVADGVHATRLVFVTNGTLDRAGSDYVQAMRGHDPELDVWDQSRLAPVAARTRAPELRADTVKLVAVSPPTTAPLTSDMELAVALVPATELVALPGIDDLSLFDRNVRLSEGRTRVNRELAATVRDSDEHVYFPAYHNGLTLLTHGLQVEGAQITLDGVTVVNGCQSLLTLHDNRGNLTDGLRLLVKVVQVPEQSSLTERITYRSNNQNPVDIRDQRSTDVIQRDLQQQVATLYGGAFAYAIREGEKLEAAQVLSNQEAAQLLMAIYLQEPWNAVRKVRLFDTDYRRIFNRDVNADRLYLVQQISDALAGIRDKLRPDLAASFASVRFTLAYLLAKVLAETDEGTELVQTPGRWLPDSVGDVRNSLASLLDEVVQSVNFYIDEEERERRERGEELDPKVIFKSQGGVRGVENVVIRDSRRLAMRDPTYLFKLAPVR
jgi:hypothetical protein